MAWPTKTFGTTHLDAGGDDPSAARADLLELANVVAGILTSRGVDIASLVDGKVPDAELGRGLANGVASLDGNGKVPAAQIDATALGVPAGTIVAFGGAVAPTGWLLCDGAAVSRNTYATLFAAIGTNWGAGDGAATFNVPDYGGRVLLGVNNTYALGSEGGEAAVTLTIGQIPEHNHPTYSYVTSGARHGAGNYQIAAPSGGKTGKTGGGQPFSIMQPYAAANFIIKT